MNRYQVMYLRVRNNGEEIQFDGPFMGPICESQADAKKAAKELIADSRHTVTIPNIFEVHKNETMKNTRERGKKYFNRIMKNMEVSEEVSKRAILTKKKRKKKK